MDHVTVISKKNIVGFKRGIRTLAPYNDRTKTLIKVGYLELVSDEPPDYPPIVVEETPPSVDEIDLDDTHELLVANNDELFGWENDGGVGIGHVHQGG